MAENDDAIGSGTYLVPRRLQKRKLTLHYLIGFASTFTNKPERSVCVDALAMINLFEKLGTKVYVGGDKKSAARKRHKNGDIAAMASNSAVSWSFAEELTTNRSEEEGAEDIDATE